MKSMKNKTFYIVLIVIALVFGGIFIAINKSAVKKPAGKNAAQKQATAILKKSFDAKATIKMKDLTLEADVNRTTNGTATIKVKEPKTLADMQFEYDGKDIKIGYKGIFVKLNENSKLVSSLVSIMVNSIDKAASDSGIDVRVNGKQLIVSGDSDSGKFSITLDKEKGSIATITLPELDFECNFDM